MGYAGSQLRESGNTLTSVQFMDIASPTGSIKLSSIVPILESGDVAGWGDVSVQYLNFDGSTDEENNYMWDGECWVDTEFNPKGDIDIPAGQGLWVNNAANVAMAFRSSGAVNLNDIIFDLRDNGNIAAANAFPTKTTLGEILPAIKGTEDVPGWGDISVQYLNFDGSTDEENNYMWDGEGWVDIEFNPKGDVDIPAAQGLWVNNASGNPITLRIPAPEL